MAEAGEKWKSNRRCHKCLLKGNTNYLWIKRVCKDDEDHWLHRLWCDEHGAQDSLTKWDGKTWSGA